MYSCILSLWYEPESAEIRSCRVAAVYAQVPVNRRVTERRASWKITVRFLILSDLSFLIALANYLAGLFSDVLYTRNPSEIATPVLKHTVVIVCWCHWSVAGNQLKLSLRNSLNKLCKWAKGQTIPWILAWIRILFTWTVCHFVISLIVFKPPFLVLFRLLKPFNQVIQYSPIFDQSVQFLRGGTTWGSSARKGCLFQSRNGCLFRSRGAGGTD